MAGGDGSQALVASVAAAHGSAYVCVPAGTRNHLAMDLGLDRDDVVGALEAFGPAVERPIDLARVGDRVFVNNASLGVYAEAVQRPGYREAKLATISETLPELLGPKAEPLDLRFVGPGGEAQRGAHVILISNNPYSLARLDGLGSRVRMDSGRLGVVVVNVAGSASAAELVALDAAGQVRRYPGWQEWDATAFTIDSGAQVAVGVDGEALSLDPPLEFAILPGALRCACPWVRPASHPPRWPWLRSARRRAWCAHGPRAGDQARRGRRAAPSLTALITGMFAARSGRQLQARSGDPLAEQRERIDERLERIEAALRDRR
jgi:diacylglycerol kinase family enzyme